MLMGPRNSKNCKINYSTTLPQNIGVPNDMFILIFDYVAISSNTQYRFSPISGSLDRIKHDTMKAVASTCKLLHKFFLGWYNLEKIVDAIIGKWCFLSPWVKTYHGLYRNIFTIEFGKSNFLKIQPLRLEFPFVDPNLHDYDEAWKQSNQKTMSFTYIEMYRNSCEELQNLVSNNFFLEGEYKIIQKAGKFRTIVVVIQFQAIRKYVYKSYQRSFKVDGISLELSYEFMLDKHENWYCATLEKIEDNLSIQQYYQNRFNIEWKISNTK